MGAVGVVAEYNPFHRGHLRHLALTRQECPEDTVICCMSGHWVQRGDCAVTDKWRRSAWAVENGADLVIELPTVFALSSAEGFARGGVAHLTAAGCDKLSFGCETPDLSRLAALASALDSLDFPEALRPYLEAGLPFPAARQKGAAALVGEETAALLEGPNNNLAVEYLRAASVDITFIPIQRTGRHDGEMEPEFPSASALRSLLREGDITSSAPHLPQPWNGPVYDLRHLEKAILCKLRSTAPEELEAFPDSGDGAAGRLWKAAREAGSLRQLYALAKTRRLTEARLRRLTLRAFLGLGETPAAPQYLRVLAMNSRGAAHLASLRDGPLPVIAKPADRKELLAGESRLTDLFSLCCAAPLPCGEEFRHSPAVFP